MKILQVNSVCSGSTGRIAAGIARVLRQTGHDSLILYGRGAPANGIDCERFESDAEVYAHVALSRLTDRQGFYSSRATRRLIARIESYRPDVIHLHNLHGYYLDWGRLFLYLSTIDVPIVWTLHDCNAFTGHCAFFDMAGCEKWRTGCDACPQKGAYPASWLLDQSARNFSEKRALTQNLKNLTLVTPSRWLSGLAEQSFLGIHPVQVIPNGIDLNVFQPTENDVREKYEIGDKRLVLGVANVWEPRKGLTALTDLSERLADSAIVALIGLNQKQLAALPRRMIGLKRTESVQQLVAWYTAADVLVNPTLEDNFPTTQLEALACGTPVVAYDTGGCPESPDERSGIVVPRGNVSALADAVLRAGELNRADCIARAKQFDQQSCYREYVRLYERLITGADK